VHVAGSRPDAFFTCVENNFFDAENVQGRVHPAGDDRENDKPTTTYDGKSSLPPKADRMIGLRPYISSQLAHRRARHCVFACVLQATIVRRY
jgi:hypothetical protein